MGVLLEPATGRRFTLAARTLVGRSTACSLALANPRVSGEHAALFYDEGGWALRDLGSSNGTRVNGQPLGLGERRSLGRGDELRFADALLVVEHDGPPKAAARGPDGRRRFADDGMLALPGADDPTVLVYPGSGGWAIERGDALDDVHDGDVVEIDGQRWTLELPEATEGGGTANTLQDSNPYHFDMLERLHIALSRDEETIELTARFSSAPALQIGHRSHHYLIAALARQNLADGHLSLAEQGWMYIDQLSLETGIGQERMYVEVYRARRHFREMGIEGSTALFERRTHTRQIRLGIRRVSIGKLTEGEG